MIVAHMGSLTMSPRTSDRPVTRVSRGEILRANSKIISFLFYQPPGREDHGADWNFGLGPAWPGPGHGLFYEVRLSSVN